ncbi:hypothetical protein OKW21_006732 [Catalinimonas alkaloidigena]|uniref:hypothetical protein n=1 Tax=Catalinimonas alkaloidigena TaxID=1075417 RepID=UPI002404CC48|nr:hypothetical protein [Catalinimonas alkaloidigena]MDF9801423.1 hypothetical protein [Catalinimonas alkaloidigena]
MKNLIFYLTILLLTSSCSDSQIVIIDEKVSSNEKLNALDSSEVFSVARWHKGDAPPKYAEFKNSELVIVKTKNYESQLQEERHSQLSQLLNEAENGNDILMILNGVEILKEQLHLLKQLKPQDLNSVERLEKGVAESIYGDNARTENVLINTYDLKTDWIDE